MTDMGWCPAGAGPDDLGLRRRGGRKARGRKAGAHAALLVALVIPFAAGAHPHVTIDTYTTVRLDQDRRVAALRAHWVFDEFYSAYVVEGLDTDGDGVYSPEELAPVADDLVTELHEWGYFTVVKQGDDAIAFERVTEYGASFEDGRLALDMTLPLAVPGDPVSAAVRIASFDPTLYIGMAPAPGDAVALEGAPPGCSADLLRRDADEPVYVPDAEANALAAELDPEDPENSLGARFAEWITITCAGRP